MRSLAPPLSCRHFQLTKNKTRLGGGSLAQISTMDKYVAWLPSPGQRFSEKKFLESTKPGSKRLPQCWSARFYRSQFSWHSSQRSSLPLLLSCMSCLPATACSLITDFSSAQSHILSSYIIYRSNPFHPPQSHVRWLLSRHSFDYADSIHLEDLLLAWRPL